MRIKHLGRLAAGAMAVMATTGVAASAAAPRDTKECDGEPVTVDMSLGEQPTPGFDVILGTEGNDLIDAETDYGNYERSGDWVCALGGDDLVVGAGWVDGGEGDDVLSGYALLGGPGDDDLIGMRRGYISYSSSTAGVRVDLRETGWQDTLGAGRDRLSGSFKYLYGSSLADRLIGNDGPNVIGGLEGDDVLIGGGGNDAFWPAAGQDRVSGGPGFDRSRTEGGPPESDWYDGGPGSDWIVDKDGGDDVFMASEGFDGLDGGDGSDLVDYRHSPAGIVVTWEDRNDATVSGSGPDDSLSAIESIVGSDFDDVLVGNQARNRIWGRDGNDVISGGGSRDRLYGGPGDDELNGGLLSDRCSGNAGTDTATACEVLSGIP